VYIISSSKVCTYRTRSNTQFC